MSLLCATCKLPATPENDAFGQPLPSCECDDPRPVLVRFDPVGRTLSYSRSEADAFAGRPT